MILYLNGEVIRRPQKKRKAPQPADTVNVLCSQKPRQHHGEKGKKREISFGGILCLGVCMEKGIEVNSRGQSFTEGHRAITSQGQHQPQLLRRLLHLPFLFQ